ncbi:SDR family oxidoreductase [Streptomyces sp. NPDC046985]|uniref:SDR family oxidoreductase n=1 Tax=Streptomyces sp. NPDC046985 TaxID=3155377 RepID=UPI0033F2CEEB
MPATWFITGASRGFGRELTEQLLARGDRVAATARRPEQLDDLAQVHGERLWTRALDVTDTAGMREVAAAAFHDLGRVDVVVSNAGYGIMGAAEELTDAEVELLLATNLTASINLARIAAPLLRKQGGGTIMQVSSMGAHVAFPGFSMYHASKWGVEGFFEAFAPEVRPFGIKTVLVEPGVIATSFYDAALSTTPLPEYEGRADIQRGDVDPAIRIGDQAKVAAAMVRAGDQQEPPRRLILGSDAYRLMRDAISDRLAAVEAQRDTAAVTDADWYTAASA